MKICLLAARFLVAFPAILLAGHAAAAQVPTTGSPTGINAAFVRLFGNVSAFTARVETRVIDPYQKEIVRMPMDFAALDSKVRLEIDLAQMQGGDFSASTREQLKQAGMDRVVSVFRPDKKATYVIYPGVQSYMIIPLAAGESEALQKGLKLEKTPLGKETIDGHPCVKNKVTVKSDKASVLQATTWNATDLKDFPIQIELKEKENRVIMRFSQVHFVKPDAKQFDPPSNYGQMK
ncbi:MAG: DUF4412 domain-containing protein [Verrucomicrobia bacterium]|nr:DUF4412 domain-containing protein [Verrucomicrobiota bacterium]